ncbi:MAG: hypothetical protein HQ579_07275, partial [Candidatus Omnitrophica bacterium]|nr:hypothetical protein [Candidatus Omnitrophota bacterium]
TIKFAKKINPDIVRFFAVSPLPNTDLWNELHGKLDMSDFEWDNIDFFKPNFDTVEISKDKISLYVCAAYWHVLKYDFTKEITIFLIPNLVKLVYLCLRTRKLRGNISKCFPRSVNLILDNMHQVADLNASEKIKFLKNVWKLEQTI